MTRQKRNGHQARMDKIHAEAQAIVASGKCPDCGAGLHENLAILGWFQCDRSGAKGFRRDLTGSPCSFQCFTR